MISGVSSSFSTSDTADCGASLRPASSAWRIWRAISVDHILQLQADDKGVRALLAISRTVNALAAYRPFRVLVLRKRVSLVRLLIKEPKAGRQNRHFDFVAHSCVGHETPFEIWVAIEARCEMFYFAHFVYE